MEYMYAERYVARQMDIRIEVATRCYQIMAHASDPSQRLSCVAVQNETRLAVPLLLPRGRVYAAKTRKKTGESKTPNYSCYKSLP